MDIVTDEPTSVVNPSPAGDEGGAAPATGSARAVMAVGAVPTDDDEDSYSSTSSHTRDVMWRWGEEARAHDLAVFRRDWQPGDPDPEESLKAGPTAPGQADPIGQTCEPRRRRGALFS